MKKLLGTVFACAALSAQASDKTVIDTKAYELPKCAQPVASLVVGKLTCKASTCQAPAESSNALAQLIALQNGGTAANFAGVGDGMGAMLTTTLKETGCFDIQEREALDEVQKELALVGKKVEVSQADFMISGSITSIDMSVDKKALGGGFIPIIGMISSTTKTANLGLDIRIIDINRARLLDSKTFEANNETSSFSLGGVGFGGGGILAGGLSSFKGTPMESILRDVLAQVSSYAAKKIVNLKNPNAQIGVIQNLTEAVSK